MIRSLDIDNLVETAPALVEMIGNVDEEVRWAAIGADKHGILLPPVSFRSKPLSPVFAVSARVLPQGSQGVIDIAAMMECGFAEPRIKAYSKLVKIPADDVSHSLDRLLAQCCMGCLIKRVSDGFRVGKLGGNRDQILALVTDLGNRSRHPALLADPRPQRFGQEVDLMSLIIEVVFALYFVAELSIKRSQHISENGLPTVPHREWSGRVGADELYLQANAVATRVAAEARTATQYMV